MKQVLIIDDDANLLESAKDILEDAGYAVRTAGTLAAARAALAAAVPDILMVDFNLPDGKGPELAREARTLKPTLQIMLMTGEVPASTGASASTDLFNVVLTKPVDPGTLLALLSACDPPTLPPA